MKHNLSLSQVTWRCLLLQCVAIGSWGMLLLVKFLIGFPLSSKIGTYAIYITAVFLGFAILAVHRWDQKIVRLWPRAKFVKDATELIHHLYDVLTVLAVLAAAGLALALVLLACGMPLSSKLINYVLTDLALYLLTFCWIGHSAFFAYDLVTMRLWDKIVPQDVP